MAYVIATPTRQQIRTHLDTNAARYQTLRNNQDWNGLTALMNDPTTSPAITRRMVQVHELVEAIDRPALIAITTQNREALQFLITAATGTTLDPENTQVRSYFAAFTGATLTRLQALQTKLGSYAEAEWGDGVTVNAYEVEAAARL